MSQRFCLNFFVCSPQREVSASKDNVCFASFKNFFFIIYYIQISGHKYNYTCFVETKINNSYYPKMIVP